VKGTIIKCMEELIAEKFGARRWRECLERSGIPDSRTNFTILSDVPEDDFKLIVKGVVSATSMSTDQLMDEFGEHWALVYAPRVYAPYFAEAKNARDLLLNLDHVHEAMTKSIKFARPPRFRYEWKGDKLLIMHYESPRGLVAMMPGLIRGVGKYYKENISARIVGNAVYVEFP
jgi:hypothetical protein